MNPLLDEVVSAYAEHGVDGVRDDRDFIELTARHGDRSASAVNLVSRIARTLERTLDGQAPHDQVSLALELFYGCRKDEDLQLVCRELTRRRYAKAWSETQREYYELGRDKLKYWRDYFLSFTNHKPSEGEVMYVNNQHKRLINLGLGEVPGLPEKRTMNLVAFLLDYMLSNSGLEGFFYPKARESTDVQERLLREAGAAFAFVQLVQSSMFDKWPNYCMDEFDAARDDESRALIFVMAEPRGDFVKRVVFQMRDWHETITAYDVLELEPTRSEARVWALLSEIKQRVIVPVKAARDELFKNVPI